MKPRRDLLRSVGKEAKRVGLFLLHHKATNGRPERWEFLSGTTGNPVLWWFPEDGHFTTAGFGRGHARSPFGALHAAIAIDRR